MSPDPTTVSVRAGGSDASYRVEIQPGLLRSAPSRIADELQPAGRVAVVSDDRVAGLYGRDFTEELVRAGADAELFPFPAGEANKTRAEWTRLTDALLNAGVGRDGLVVGLGGGVTGDLAGFVAASYMRGIPILQIPTSLLAMIDASVGGKTGVDTPAGKNLVGAFHPPLGVWIDPDVLSTLPAEERAQGLAEALKHGAILDPEYFQQVADAAPGIVDGDLDRAAEVVARSVEIKADVVSRDEREGGFRKVLNFGHTLGHGIEAASDYRLGHGSAVALGMVLEARLGEAMQITAAGTSAALREAVAGLGLPGGLSDVPEPAIEADRVLSLLATDKKARAGSVRYVLLDRIGRVSEGSGWVHAARDSDVRAVLSEGG
jgi:3-dehydroquinate synthase